MAAPTALPVDATCVHQAPDRHESARRMGWVLGITATVMVAEAVGAWASHSLALLADAGHMLADVAALGLAVVVARVAQRPATAERTFGLLRLEIFAAFINGAVLLVIAVGIGVEAFRRLAQPPGIRAGILLGVAGVGLVANLVSARILHHGHDHSLNQRGAYLHVLSDVLGSLGAIAAGLVVLATGWLLADPIISVGIGLLIVSGSVRLVKESVDVLLEATPSHISLVHVHDQIASVPGVTSVHDLHVWTVTSGVVAMSGHLLVQDPADNQRVLEAVQERMGKLKIKHVTVQMEKDPTCE
ncbi:MAG TPA: cation diffusion facilitator family transporter [Gemmatimonadales bacterium]|nr:cation diffusion facilitator family transporter [Gemmatimonadales bacterium]